MLARILVCAVLCLLPGRASADIMGYVASLTGMMLQISIHETGHAVVASAVGWEVTEFKPYPHICGGRLVGGCVHALPDTPFVPSEDRMVSAAGSMFSNIGVLALAPLQKSFKSGGFASQTLGSLLTYQKFDWLFYTVIDSVTDFQGDWYAVSESLGVPTWYFIAPAALNTWLLHKYQGLFVRRKVVTPKEPSPPAKAYVVPDVRAVASNGKPGLSIGVSGTFVF